MRRHHRWVTPVVIVGLTLLVAGAGGVLVVRAQRRTGAPALSTQSYAVSVVASRSARFRQRRRYVGRIEPWLEARVGPQYVSAYVESVRVRPGALVRRGEILAKLDCRGRVSSREAAALHAHALDVQHRALADEASRYAAMLKDRFVAEIEVTRRLAASESVLAELHSSQARLAGASLEEKDCVLRAPFDGEIGERDADPGAFVRPGQFIVTVVDRGRVRIVAEVPEQDFALVAPETAVRLHLVATGARLTRPISRRSLTAHASTRTVRIEIDVEDKQRTLPVGTTAEVDLEERTALAATELPLRAAKVRGDYAEILVVEQGLARKRTLAVLGERGGSLFVCAELPAGSRLVLDGRALVQDGDTVSATEQSWPGMPLPEGPPPVAPKDRFPAVPLGSSP